MRKNSVLYTHDKKYIVANEMGVSINTYNKYLNECHKLNLIRQNGKGKVFISLFNCIGILFPEDTNFRFVRFFDGRGCKTVNQFYEQIKLALFARNARSQQYNIDRKKAIDSLSNNCIEIKTMNALKSLSKDNGCSISELPRICKRINSIVTGKNHLSSLIGCSISTASKLLRKWHKNRSINRTVVFKNFFIPVNNGSFDAIKEMGYQHIRVNKDNTGFNVPIGSKVDFTVSVFFDRTKNK